MATNQPENRALMIGSDSDSDSDYTEFGSPGKNGPSRSGRVALKTLRHMEGSRNRCQTLSATELGLIFSVLINLALFVVVLWTATGYFPDVCKEASSQKAASSHLNGSDGNCFDVMNSFTSSPPVLVTERPKKSSTTPPSSPPSEANITCVMSSVTCGSASQRIEPLLDSDYVNLFQDLSPTEISAAVNHLLQQTDLHLQARSNVGNRIFGVELFPPVKASALEFWDSGGARRPPREALVTVIFDRENPPVLRQYVVGPLPNPMYHNINPRMRKDVPLKFFGRHRLGEAYQAVVSVTQAPELQHVLQESFGATFQRCGDKCLMPLAQMISFGLVNATTFVFAAYYKTEFPTIQPVPFQIIFQENALGRFTVHSVFYAGATFVSISELVRRYDQGTIFKVRRQFPTNAPGEDSIPGSLNLRGVKFPETPHAPPRQYEPRGPRYSIADQHVKYLQWSFNVRQSVESGPQLWDIQWGGERVVYELSLQEVVVLYAGANPAAMFSLLSDSAFGLGDAAKRLVPGVDCPEHATFLSTAVYNARESSYSVELPNALCVFEHNSGVPLRRHSRTDDSGSQYGGLVDHVLIVRTIIVEYNYDYIFDFVFHHNGALEARVYATGYIMAQWFHYGEDPFGFRVHEDVVGSVHHHLFHFKVDMDIGGTSNRYETLDFSVDDREWPWLSVLKPESKASSSSDAGKLEQISYKHHVRETERDAVYHFNFDHPKYHIFYNDEVKNKFGNPRAYRVAGRGFSKQILPDAHPALHSRKWAQYQMAVTTRKEEEGKSSSIFSMYDAEDPTADFEEFLRNDENILDKDLVTWVTLGMHHIPHTEDIPNTPTPGTEAAILLLPFNYFPEDPSIGSRDAVRADRVGSRTRFQLYGTDANFTCIPPVYMWLTDSSSTSYP